MSAKTFIDTNVLAYAVDRDSPSKQRCARELLGKVEKDGGGVISTQVLQEFFVTATRKLGIEPLVAKGLVEPFLSLEVVMVDTALIKEAMDCSILDQIAFWDALIVVSAAKAHCGRVWTEDLNAGQSIRGVRIENPFLERKR